MRKSVPSTPAQPRPQYPAQMLGDGIPHRAEHVWFRIPDGPRRGYYKCCLCGAIAVEPPPFPTPDDWMPLDYELPLTPDERRMCPNPSTEPK